MSNLTVHNNEVLTMTSLEVAEMVGRNHADVLRDIRKIISHLSNESKSALVKYFLESSYVDGKGESRSCFNLTKKGCELYATRMTGAKGTLFAVKYIEKFNEMEEEIKNKVVLHSYMIDDPIKRAEKWIEEQKEKQRIQQQLMIAEPKASKYDEFLNADGYITGEKAAKALGIGRNTLYKFLRDNGIWTKDNIPYQRFINQELFKVVHKTIIGVGVTSVTLFTTKGVDYIADKLKDNK